MTNRLNYFEPYERKESHHEDQLTRAFLVLCRYVPLVQALFIDLIRMELIECSVTSPPPMTLLEGVPTIRTQTGMISETSGTVLSVLMTNEETTVAGDIQWSDRTPRYDGCLSWGDWVIIIENKPWNQNVWRDQLNPSRVGLPDEHELLLHPKGVALAWKDLISGITSLVSRGLVSGAEAQIVDDFREFLARRFPFLNPYERLSHCEDAPYLVRKRLEDILSEIGELENVRGGSNPLRLRGGIAKYAYLRAVFSEDGESADSVTLSIYPADTVGQARSFYRKADEEMLERMENLEANGWQIQSNLHFTYMGTGICDAEGSLEWRDFIQFWREHTSDIGQEIVHDVATPNENRQRSAALDKKMQGWKMNGLLTDAEIAEIDVRFTKTKRRHINVAPGFSMKYMWRFEHAKRLDDEKELVAEIRNRTKEALHLWGGSIEARVANSHEE